jgi:hypothetical protein
VAEREDNIKMELYEDILYECVRVKVKFALEQSRKTQRGE